MVIVYSSRSLQSRVRTFFPLTVLCAYAYQVSPKVIEEEGRTVEIAQKQSKSRVNGSISIFPGKGRKKARLRKARPKSGNRPCLKRSLVEND